MTIIPPFNPYQYEEILIPLLRQLSLLSPVTPAEVTQLLHTYTKPSGLFKKTDIMAAFSVFAGKPGIASPSKALQKVLLVKPVRTQSGVTPVTVLTKPYPCPGNCIFCPSDIKMPKSYLSNEPGAQRAANHRFDPYLQTLNRLTAFKIMGHIYDKVELLVLGGTWSVYPATYQRWFIKRLLEALNDFAQGIADDGKVPPTTTIKPQLVENYNQAFSKKYRETFLKTTETASWEELELEQSKNATSRVRCVGLVLETRPDYITPAEVRRLRRLGATKIQIGIQSLDDHVLARNKRGHSLEDSIRAVSLLRAAGFKLHLHWMPNLYGSTPTKDIADYQRLWKHPAFKPDELKIYPCSLIAKTPLMDLYTSGQWRPYSHEELLRVVSACLALSPRYCRLTRVVRDIPSTDIVVGNKYTNFRQMAEQSLYKSGRIAQEIRSREVKQLPVSLSDVTLKDTVYTTTGGTNHFLEYVTLDDKIAGFLRLFFPNQTRNPVTAELDGVALIREVHVYGPTLHLGRKTTGAAQHSGLGKRLIQQAIQLAQQKGFHQISVISAIGTREYYRKLGFIDGDLYQHYEC